MTSWYKDIIYFLLNFRCPPNFEKSKVRSLKLKSMKYCIVNKSLFWKDHVGSLLKCVDEYESQEIMIGMHQTVYGGDHYWKATSFNILRVRYYCPTLFSYVFVKVKTCEQCQQFTIQQKLLAFPLKHVITNGPFE